MRATAPVVNPHHSPFSFSKLFLPQEFYRIHSGVFNSHSYVLNANF